ncbi:hypothetical protein L596_027242 [Steinernema carpocapsae]|uniref:NADH dehydrogenase [ubiquinone] 1 alpha subcomplex subunit 13 n=1 Tax=Steinernema carpocapsae TaxID=34508 RepID=A0A4U5M3S9_STECR|nr:hypothetical protein L596_027242 [Steinernema carpocapsae]
MHSKYAKAKRHRKPCHTRAQIHEIWLEIAFGTPKTDANSSIEQQTRRSTLLRACSASAPRTTHAAPAASQSLPTLPRLGRFPVFGEYREGRLGKSCFMTSRRQAPKQDMPPPGGYRKFNFARTFPKVVWRPGVMVGVIAGCTSYGAFQTYIRTTKRRSSRTWTSITPWSRSSLPNATENGSSCSKRTVTSKMRS